MNENLTAFSNGDDAICGLNQGWQRTVFDVRKTVFSFDVLFEVCSVRNLQRLFCSMLYVLFDVSFVIFGMFCLMFRSVDVKRASVLFIVLFGTRPVLSVVLFERVVLFDVVFQVDMTHTGFCSWVRSQSSCCVRSCVRHPPSQHVSCSTICSHLSVLFDFVFANN